MNDVLFWQSSLLGDKTLQIMQIRVQKGSNPTKPRLQHLFLVGNDVDASCNTCWKDPESVWLREKHEWHGSFLARQYFYSRPMPLETKPCFLDYQVALGYMLASHECATFITGRVPSASQIKLAKKWGIKIRIRDLLVS